MFKPMLSQIKGGVELRSDVDTLKTSYDAAKVLPLLLKVETAVHIMPMNS